VASSRRYRTGWILAPALAFSAALQGGAIAAYYALRPEPPPRLWLTIESSSEALDDHVVVTDERGETLVQCWAEDDVCRIDLRPGAVLRVDAFPGSKSTFNGWDGCTTQDDVLRCEVPVAKEDLKLHVAFGQRPEEVNVAMLPLDDFVGVELPPERTPPPPPDPIDAEKLEEDQVEVALVEPLQPQELPPPVPQPPPPPPPPEQQKQDQPPPPPPEMRMVEVPDENEVEDAPDDATHLSDKNRDVAEETRATETNLEKEMKGEEIASAPSEDQSEEVGGPEEDIAQLEESESDNMERFEESDKSGRDEVAKGQVEGEEGDNGQEGAGDKNPGMLAMRGIEGRGNVAEQGDNKKKGRKGKEGVKTQLDFDDYERIVGRERADKEREIAKRNTSQKKGRYQKRIAEVKSALENFTPDIKAGNQTALKTRAHPFALYVARMHRKIHELWGFGFLEDLDSKSSDSKMNDQDLMTTIELALNPDGTVFKVGVAKGSGVLEFDVAAIHTVQAAAPYGQTPEKIRSVDGRVYLRWGFYRNWRQCGTFNVEPAILSEIPGGIVALDQGMDTRDGKVSAADAENDYHETKPTKPEPPPEDGPVVAKGPQDADKSPNAPGDDAATEQQAKYAANMWVAGFSSGKVDRMLKVSALPFYAGTERAAGSVKELRTLYDNLIGESGAVRSWQFADVSAVAGGALKLTEGSRVVQVVAKETFYVVLVPTKGGEFRAQAIVR
jgi:TonB family protein